MKHYDFEAARPVWAENKETQMNVSLLLRAVLPAGCPATLRIAAHSRYQIFINGGFFAEGPARAAHGFFRVSEYALAPAPALPHNVVAILVTGYNANSFSLTDQPAFVCAEIAANGEVLYATGSEKPFEAGLETHRIQKTPRFSFQRPFTEAYHLDAAFDAPRKDASAPLAPCVLRETEAKTFIARETPYCVYEERKAVSVLRRGALLPEKDLTRAEAHHQTEINENVKGWPEDELSTFPIRELLCFAPQTSVPDAAPTAPVRLEANGWAVYDMAVNTSGFLHLGLTAEQDAVIYAVFADKLTAQGLPVPGNDSTQNCVKWTLQGGRSYDLVSFAPYTYRYIQIVSLNAPVLVTGVAQYREDYPPAGIRPAPALPDDALKRIYNAAVETFRQNATDIFMDCPSRERAGWLCDSFFTARTEYALTGKSLVEKAFLENFLLPERFPCVPKGMLPMCYPSDHPGGGYIPNWAMWYALETEEYYARSGDGELIARAKPRLYALADFLAEFENADGLLEKLESWVFVEWSKANDYVQDVNYPTNMLYSRFLEALGNLYADGAFKEKAAALREAIRRQAFNGKFFIDNAVRTENGLVPTQNHTETAQYYAFFTGVATPVRDPALYRTLLEDFGPQRDPEKQYPDVPVSNAFIGNFLRLEILFRNGEHERLLNEIRAFFLPMALQTGTLWENMTDFASCCHGFASHVAVWLRALFGGAAE